MPTTLEALVIVALVLAPGYVFSLFAGEVIAFARREQTDTSALLPTITCGTIVHAVLSPWTLRVLDYYRSDTLSAHDGELVLWGTSLVLVIPALLGVATGQVSNIDMVDQLLDKIGLGYIDRMPSAWDYVLRKEEPAFVRVYMTNGQLIAGAFSSQSFASTTPGRADICLEEAWEKDADGKLIRPIAGSSGV
jgi:hypothetical protein